MGNRIAIGTLVFAAIAGLFGLIVIFGSFYTIDQGERGVILRNGAFVGTAEPGFHLKMPIFDDIEKISVQSHVWRGTLPTYSRDQQPADLTVSVNLRAVEGEVAKIYADYGSLDNMVERIVAPRSTAAIKTVFGAYQAATAIAERAKLNVDSLEEIRKELSGNPVVIEGLQIEDIEFSDAYEASVEQRMLAEVEVQKLKQNAQRETVQAQIKVTQAGADRDAAKAQADGSAYATRERAKADADAIRLRGEAEAVAIAARGKALRDNPDLVRLVTAEKWDGSLPVTMVPNGTLPMLNLTTDGVVR